LTGKPVYFAKPESRQDLLTIVRASCSLPLISPIIPFQGKFLLDDGITDPIPLMRSISDGNEKNVVILTKTKGYRKQPFKLKWLAQHGADFTKFTTK
jgi:predicted patatin/cPLA2 family phospholipase